MAVPTQDVTNLVSLLSFLLYVGYPCLPLLYTILLHFPHDQSNKLSQPFSRTTAKNFQGTSDLFSEVSNFQQRTNV